MREALFKIVATNKYIVTINFSNLQYSGSSSEYSDYSDKPEYCKFKEIQTVKSSTLIH